MDRLLVVVFRFFSKKRRTWGLLLWGDWASQRLVVCFMMLLRSQIRFLLQWLHMISLDRLLCTWLLLYWSILRLTRSLFRSWIRLCKLLRILVCNFLKFSFETFLSSVLLPRFVEIRPLGADFYFVLGFLNRCSFLIKRCIIRLLEFTGLAVLGQVGLHAESSNYTSSWLS